MVDFNLVRIEIPLNLIVNITSWCQRFCTGSAHLSPQLLALPLMLFTWKLCPIHIITTISLSTLQGQHFENRAIVAYTIVNSKLSSNLMRLFFYFLTELACMLYCEYLLCICSTLHTSWSTLISPSPRLSSPIGLLTSCSNVITFNLYSNFSWRWVTEN